MTAAMKYQFEIGFMDYMPWSDDELTRGVRAGKHDCMVCGELLTHATVSIVGRAILTDEMALFGVCRKCRRDAGSFKKASRRAAEAFRDLALAAAGRSGIPKTSTRAWGMRENAAREASLIVQLGPASETRH